MNIETLREYCMQKKGASEEFPFDENTLVFKVKDKIFALADIDSKPLRLNLKCEPSKAIELRERYGSVMEGYHMNKKHWNTILADGSIPDQTLKEWIDESYMLVAKGLTKKQKQEIGII
jgi:predicted DNA-binding protein (MmcQ/YjbR family)